MEARNFLLVITFRLFDGQDALARADELFVLIVKTVEAMAAYAALGAVELLALIQDWSVLGNHVSRMALLATGLKILPIIEWP